MLHRQFPWLFSKSVKNFSVAVCPEKLPLGAQKHALFVGQIFKLLPRNIVYEFSNKWMVFSDYSKAQQCLAHRFKLRVGQSYLPPIINQAMPFG